MVLFFFLNNLFFTHMDNNTSSKLSVLKIHKHILSSHWIQNSLPLLMKPALESLLELPQSTTINTPNKKSQQGCTKYRTFQVHKKIQEDDRVWKKNVS